MLLFNLDFSNSKVAIVNIAILLFIVMEIINGYKKGFLESSVRLVGFIAAIVGAYLLKNSVSVYMYTHLPFFKFEGLFKGVSALNIIVYEVISFILVFIVLLIVLKIIAKITNLVERVLSLIFFIGLPSKILGALVGFLQGMIILYFAIFVFKVGCNIAGFGMEPSLADDIINIPVLRDTFGASMHSLDEITALATSYEDTKDKEEFNKQAIDILLKYNVITKENLQILVDNGKIKFND